MIHRGRSSRARALCGGGGCFCLWKRGRKRQLVSSLDVRCSFARVRGVSEKSPAGTGSHWHPSSSGLFLRGCRLSWDNSHAKSWVCPFTPLAVFPKCSIAVHLQKGETFEGDGFALKSKIPCECQLLRMWLCLLAVC